MSVRRKTSSFVIFCMASAFLALIMLPRPAAAQCLAGIPCVVPKTANDPSNPSDGPNAAGAPNALKSESAACDADFMNQIYARAFLESQRENIMHQITVRKPDSVLEYTCFDKLASITAHLAGPLFSESTYWLGRVVPTGTVIWDGGSPVAYPTVIVNVYMGPTRLDQSLSLLVMQSLLNYVDTNFGHAFLGHAASGPPPLDDDIIGSISLPSYMCAWMDSVHWAAKCRDFGIDDVFFDFPTLASLDPRIWPETCSGSAINNGLLDVASNNNFAHVNFDPVAPTYLNMMSSGGPCQPPVPTGVMVQKYTRTLGGAVGNVMASPHALYESKVCPNPGCYYDPAANICAP